MQQYVYVFVRQDLSIAVQSVQSQHAIYLMAVNYRPSETIPNLVWIGVPNKTSLQKTLKKLKDNQIPHFQYVEPDDNLGLTAIATVPIQGSIRDVLYNYRIHNGGGRVEQSMPCERNLDSSTMPLDSREVCLK